ncbi:MAG TPA: P-loop NTPase [Candidatus Nanopelagicaceae bacterium]|nr:P-loop NTPase [Candidatus Nanopelagicaceae bacterium]
MVKPKIICVTGGKGGTGKTMVAVNLATMFKNRGYKVLLIDGDVENPNTYLLLNGKLKNKTEVPYFLPKILEDKCNKCGFCAENCATHALLYIKDSIPILISTVCSGCKLCYKICPTNAIEADLKVIGWIYTSSAFDIDLFIGELKPSEARSAAVVKTLMKTLEKDIITDQNKYDIVILDTAPGAHCDVEELINQADLVIPVTEPTRFGKLDLLRIIELINLLNKEYRVIVNRSSLLGYKEKFLLDLEEKGIEVLGDIPLDEDIVSSYCQGIPLMESSRNSDKNGMGYKSFNEIFEKLMEWGEFSK